MLQIRYDAKYLGFHACRTVARTTFPYIAGGKSLSDLFHVHKLEGDYPFDLKETGLQMVYAVWSSEMARRREENETRDRIQALFAVIESFAPNEAVYEITVTQALPKSGVDAAIAKYDAIALKDLL